MSLTKRLNIKIFKDFVINKSPFAFLWLSDNTYMDKKTRPTFITIRALTREMAIEMRMDAFIR